MNTHLRTPLAALVCLAALSSASASAEVVLPAVLGDGVVLKRSSSVPLWGTARPDLPVSIRIGWSDALLTTVADATGRWRCEVPTGPAGGPYEIVVMDSDGPQVIRDVHLGEVWLCSGQSNMEWPLSAVLEAYKKSSAFDEAHADGASPRIRLFAVPRRMSLEPLEDVNATWRPCTLADSAEFSAVAYFFACALEARLGVPIGLVGASWGGTPVEAWVSAPTIERFPRHSADLAALANANTQEGKHRLAEATIRWWEAATALTPESTVYGEMELDDSRWQVLNVPGAWEHGPLGDYDGIVWHRRVVDVPAELAWQTGVLSLGPIDDDDKTLWNGQWIGATGGHTIERRYAIPGELVQAGRNVIAIAVHDSGGAGGFHGDAEQLYVELTRDGQAPLRIALDGAWRAAAVAAPKTRYPRSRAMSPSTPTVLYNGLIAPLAPFRFSGAIWYQGESNRYDPVLYRETFPALIDDWRAHFEFPELPFLWAQIAPFDYGEGARGGHSTALLRDAQDRTLALPHTGQSILSDVGDLKDIHPIDKWTVGERLARLALAGVYGVALDPNGPRVASHAVEGSKVRVTFAHADGGLVARGEKLNWFHVAGADKMFHAASAVIDGTSVIVSCPEVVAPVAVRFGWSDVAEPNLFDTDGLPAAPFRTDDWDDVVIGS
jgi:sialate O-acetylesterase